MRSSDWSSDLCSSDLTGVSGQAKVAFDYSSQNMNNADSVEFYTNRTGPSAIKSGTGHHEFTVSGLSNGTGNTVEVWATTYANSSVGGGSDASARRQVSVTTYGQCPVDVSHPHPAHPTPPFDRRA